MFDIGDITELKGLNVEEVSLVKKPANERKFLIVKQERGYNMELDVVLKSLDDLEIDLENEEDIEKSLKKMKLSDQACKAVKGALKLMSAYKEQMPKDMMAKMAMMAGYGMPGAPGEMVYEIPVTQAKMPPDKGKGGTPPNLYAPPMAAKKVKKEDGTLDLDAIPEESRELVQMLWKEQETAIKKADQLEADLKIEREIRITKEYQERGAKFPNIGTAESVGAILKTAYEVSAEYGLQVETSLKDADSRIEKSELFKEIGSEASGVDGGAWGKIEELAKSIVTKGEGQTMAQAIDRVLAENPKLYEEYTNERSGK